MLDATPKPTALVAVFAVGAAADVAGSDDEDAVSPLQDSADVMTAVLRAELQVTHATTVARNTRRDRRAELLDVALLRLCCCILAPLNRDDADRQQR